jgi:hypothetical protein
MAYKPVVNATRSNFTSQFYVIIIHYVDECYRADAQHIIWFNVNI